MRISIVLLILIFVVHFSQEVKAKSDNFSHNINYNSIDSNISNVSSLNGTEEFFERNVSQGINIVPNTSQLIKDNAVNIKGSLKLNASTNNGEQKKTEEETMKMQPALGLILDEPEIADRRSNIEDLYEITAYDWETGEELMEGFLENKQLFVRKSNALLTFNAQKEGTTSPVHLRFEGMSPETCDGKWRYLTLKICLVKEKICKDGCAICYVGKMDPANRPSLLDPYRVPNLADTDHPDLCKKEELKGWENKTVHAIYLKTNDYWNIEMSTSFSKGANDKGEMFTLKPNAENCVFLKIGSESEPIGTVVDADHQERWEKDMESFWHYLANSGDLADLHFLNILPFDVFADFQENEPLLAFASSKDCGMEISVNGPLERCTSQQCDRLMDNDDSPNGNSLYETQFHFMKPVIEESDLPEEYNDNVMFRTVDDHPQAVVSTSDREITFAVLTKTSRPPAGLSIYRQPHAFYCLDGRNFDVNEFVLAYNGRPDCYGLFALGETRLRFRENLRDMFDAQVVGVKDFPLVFKGDGLDYDNEFWTIDRYGDPALLGSGTCPIEGEMYYNQHGVKEIPVEAYIWKFILNPKCCPLTTPIIQDSRCRLGIVVNLTENFFLVTDYQSIYDKNHEQQTTEEFSTISTTEDSLHDEKDDK